MFFDKEDELEAEAAFNSLVRPLTGGLCLAARLFNNFPI
jgi:hypothetical protein